jgi:signal transduction histidine kinase
MAELVAHKHFGLAGMHERAALIGAELNIDSAPDKGARVWVKWKVVGQD